MAQISQNADGQKMLKNVLADQHALLADIQAVVYAVVSALVVNSSFRLMAKVVNGRSCAKLNVVRGRR